MPVKKTPSILILIFGVLLSVILKAQLFAMVLLAMVPCLLVDWLPRQSIEIARSGNE